MRTYVEVAWRLYLKGYELIFQDASIISGYANTIIYTVCATALVLCWLP